MSRKPHLRQSKAQIVGQSPLGACAPRGHFSQFFCHLLSKTLSHLLSLLAENDRRSPRLPASSKSFLRRWRNQRSVATVGTPRAPRAPFAFVNQYVEVSR